MQDDFDFACKSKTACDRRAEDSESSSCFVCRCRLDPARAGFSGAVVVAAAAQAGGGSLTTMLHSQNCVHIDGSILEGGGQVVRIATCLSALLGSAIFIDKIRAGRSKPGLAGYEQSQTIKVPQWLFRIDVNFASAQHAAGIHLVASMCSGWSIDEFRTSNVHTYLY